MELRIDKQTRGVRILIGEEARRRRMIVSTLSGIAESYGFEEIVLPSLEPADIYTDKAGNEILGQMYVFPDKKGRQLCLRPEGTATCQLIADSVWKSRRDVKIWYETRCWRYERPQAGRYREFLQFGVEWLNPRLPVRQTVVEIAIQMISALTDAFQLLDSVQRGLAYYIEDGFEIICPELGAQKQVLGGGSYKQGCGFAIGVDRLLLVEPRKAVVQVREEE